MWHVAALIGIFLPFLFSWVGLWQTYDTLKDLSFVLLSYSAYVAMPFREYHFKVITSVTFLSCLYALIHNVMIDFSVMGGALTVFASYLSMILFCVMALTFIMYRWESIKSDEFLEGRFYRVYGKPRYGLGMIAFYFSLGKFGEHFITDGKHVWKFCKVSREFERIDFNLKYVNNRKIVLIDTDISDKLNLKLGSKWSLFNNCIFL